MLCFRQNSVRLIRVNIGILTPLLIQCLSQQEDEIEKMRELNEQNQRLMDENEQYKQVNAQMSMCKDNRTL